MQGNAYNAKANHPQKLPKAILFDWDNTLVDSWPVIHKAINATLKEFGHRQWSIEQTRSQVRKSLRDSFPVLFGDRWQEAGAFYYACFSAIHIEKLKPLSGAEKMLNELQKRGVYLGVISNKKGDYLRQEASHLGWDVFFGNMVGASDATKDKPAVEPVDMALSGSGIGRGNDVWLVGDTDVDMQCAINSGCIPVLLRTHPPTAKEFTLYPPAWYFEGCIDLCNIVRKL